VALLKKKQPPPERWDKTKPRRTRKQTLWGGGKKGKNNKMASPAVSKPKRDGLKEKDRFLREGVLLVLK